MKADDAAKKPRANAFKQTNSNIQRSTSNVQASEGSDERMESYPEKNAASSPSHGIFSLIFGGGSIKR